MGSPQVFAMLSLRIVGKSLNICLPVLGFAWTREGTMSHSHVGIVSNPKIKGMMSLKAGRFGFADGVLEYHIPAII